MKLTDAIKIAIIFCKAKTFRTCGTTFVLHIKAASLVLLASAQYEIGLTRLLTRLRNGLVSVCDGLPVCLSRVFVIEFIEQCKWFDLFSTMHCCLFLMSATDIHRESKNKTPNT